MPTIRDLVEEIDKKKAKGGFSFKNPEAHKKEDPMTPGELVSTVFHGGPKALLHSMGKRGRARKEKFLKDKKNGITKTRSFKRNDSGKVIMEEKTIKKDK